MPIVDLPETCMGCAGCCWLHAEVEEGDPTPLGLTEIDPEDGKRYMKRGKDMWCVALDKKTKLCTIYDKRPTCCREFEPGTKPCFDALYAVRYGVMATEFVKFERFFKRMRVPYEVLDERSFRFYESCRMDRADNSRPLTEICKQWGGVFNGIDVNGIFYCFDEDGEFLFTWSTAREYAFERLPEDEEDAKEADTGTAGADGVPSDAARTMRG